MMQKDGSGYEGNWKDDVYHGQGIKYQKGGIVEYDGSFYEGRVNGVGHLDNIASK